MGATTRILTEVLPTIRRRLDTNWHNPFPEPDGSPEFHIANAPLPDFVPRALFADLSLPEVTIRIPGATVRDDETEETLRSLRRYEGSRPVGSPGIYHRAWVSATLDSGGYRGGNQAIDLERISRHRQLIDRIDADGETFDVYRPWELDPIKPPAEVLDSSHANRDWRTRIDVDSDEALRVEPPNPSFWSHLVTGLDFFVHSRRTSAFVLRAAIRANGTLNLKNGDAGLLPSQL